MKISRLLVILLAIFFSANVQAQSPQSINYQAVVRDANGVVVMNRVVSFRLSILTGGSTGTPQYVETHNATTNTFGLVTLNIGLGTPTTGAMSAVTWATGSKFLRVEVDINGGSNFTTLGTTQFLSVPYALYAATSGTSAASGWGLSGNTVTSANYIGTNNLEDMRFYSSGTQKMVLKTSGYVGIGTNTPDFKMVIENDAESTAGIDDGRTLLQLHNKSLASFATTNLRIKTGNTSNVTMLAHYGPTYTQYPNFADYGLMLSTGPGLMMQAPAGNIRFMTGPAPNNVGINDRMIITNEGSVGIGTMTPTHRLRVETNTDAGNSIDRLQMQLHNSSNNSEAFGGLGISSGTSGTNTWLEHLGANYNVYGSTYPDFKDMTYFLSTGSNGMYLLSGSDGPNTKIRFAVGSSNNVPATRMTLTKTGLGLGTETPTARLHNIGTARFEGLGANNAATRLLVADASGNLALRDVSTLPSGSGGSGWSLTGNTTTSTDYLGTNNSDDLRLYTAGTQKMVVKSAGNVGIGTNTPTHRLRVETNTDAGNSIDRLQMQLHNSSNNSEAFGGLGISSGTSGTNTWLEHLGANYGVYSSTYPDFNDMTYFLSTGSNGMYLLSGSDGPNTKIRFAVGSSNSVPATRMTLNKTGLGLGTETPKAKIEVASGDVYVSDPTRGIILKSPNGGCWRVTIDNTGNFVRTSIACPN